MDLPPSPEYNVNSIQYGAPPPPLSLPQPLLPWQSTPAWTPQWAQQPVRPTPPIQIPKLDNNREYKLEEEIVIGHFECSKCDSAFSISRPDALDRPFECRKCKKKVWALETIGTQKTTFRKERQRSKQVMTEGWNSIKNNH